MAQQYGRRWSLVVGAAGGKGLDLSELHFKFETHRATPQTPGWAVMRIYNVAQSTALTIQREFTNVFLQAGYPENFGMIFSGKIRQKRTGRENGTDTFLEIIAQDGDTAYNWAVTGNQPGTGKSGVSLRKGWKSQDVLDQCAQAMAPFGVTLSSQNPAFADYANPRGCVLFGMSRDHMRTLANTTGTTWCISNEQLTVIPDQTPLPGTAVELSATTGLIGVPQLTLDGINLRCLLNPAIRFGGVVHVNNASIIDRAIDGGIGPTNVIETDPASPNFGRTKQPGLDQDGRYKVYSVQHSGDTRGTPWYTDLITVAVDGTKPLTGPYINAIASKGA